MNPQLVEAQEQFLGAYDEKYSYLPWDVREKAKAIIAATFNQPQYQQAAVRAGEDKRSSFFYLLGANANAAAEAALHNTPNTHALEGDIIYLKQQHVADPSGVAEPLRAAVQAAAHEISMDGACFEPTVSPHGKAAGVKIQ